MMKYDTHPAYGMVAFHRISGSPGKMFGSQLAQHGQFISLQIKRAERAHEYGQDWFHGRQSLVEVWLSAAQFAELLTTMNVGDGVPCTINRLMGKSVERMPEDEQTEAEKVSSGFTGKMRKLSRSIREGAARAREKLLSKGTLKVSDRKNIAALLGRVQMELDANIPFVLESFQEAVEKTSTHAKAEIDALYTSAVERAGMEALGIEVSANRLLEEGDDPVS